MDVTLVPGLSLEAELVYHPSNYPLRAVVKNRLAAVVPLTTWPAHPTIAGGLAAYSEALARQPWLETFPLDDRSQEVRRIAADLLARLVESRLVQRFANV